ncbi:MAG: TonB-dependent receptor [Calditrichaeota bacterium]|nr:TonB-dependent receptor [Calditrichota bacterium]
MSYRSYCHLLVALGLLLFSQIWAQGVTTASLRGIVSDTEGAPMIGANVVAVHEPSGTRYGAATRETGQFNIYNMRIGGPYTIEVTFVGYKTRVMKDVYLQLGQDTDADFTLVGEAVQGEAVEVVGDLDDVMNGGRTGAATYIDPEDVDNLPTISRSTRDLTRLDPRSDGNFSFGGKNWLFNNISLDGSYFNNPFGLDDPAPGGQAGAEPVPYEAIEQVQVSIAPFDVREGGFTGAGINSVTKSGSNTFQGSVYTFTRNESFQGNEIRGQKVVANPDLAYNQSGFTLGGPIVKDKLFFFMNGELVRRDDPGSDFVANEEGTPVEFGESRVTRQTMDAIRQRMIDVYGYDPGPYQGYIHETNNNKFLLKLDWNINSNNSLSLRYNYLDAARDLPPNFQVLSFNGTGRGPNATSLPFQNAGYQINNELNSIALELNSHGQGYSNRFFASYNRFRDFRNAFSDPFPTIDIGEDGVTYTTLGHEPFSINNVLDQDVFQITNNYSFFRGKHVITAGSNFEYFSFFNSFNIFRHGVFFLPQFIPIGSQFGSLDEFFAATDPNAPDSVFKDFRSMIGSGPFKGEKIQVGQLAFYAQDEWLVNPRVNLTYGLRVDLPMYFTDPVDNPFSRGLTLLDENDNPESVDQSSLPGATPLFSPRVGFNWDVKGNRSLQMRGGTGVFTGRIPFVWVGNVISNPGNNPNLYPNIPLAQVPSEHETSDDAILQTSFDLNAMDPDFKWPQAWTTNLAVDQDFGHGLVGTLEFLYSKDINAVYMRNADIRTPVRFLEDGRPYFTDANGVFELNPDGNAGAYIIDNTSEGYNYSITAQVRKFHDWGLNTSLAYTFLEAKNQLRSTEIASVLWTENPVQGDPNNPNLSYSGFGNRHRVVGSATYGKRWNANHRTQFGLVLEIAQGNRYLISGGNRYSFIYSGDVNGDGSGANDLIYIPEGEGDINLQDYVDANGNTVSAARQWNRLDAFIEQDDYLSQHRGEIAERYGLLNPFYTNLDFRILQDVAFMMGPKQHNIQVSLDFLNVLNLLNSDWGVRKVANPAALSPLRLAGFDANGEPVLNFTGPEETFIDDPNITSRWRVQLGVKYFFN